MSAAPTLAACLTPPGSAAIATLGLRGPETWSVLQRLFKPRTATSLPDEPVVGRIWLGRLGDELADEVVVAVRAIFPVPEAEIHTHGGVLVVRLLLETLQRHGVAVTSWQDFESAKGDHLRAVAQAALAQARTVRAASILLDQVSGAFARAVGELQDAWGRQDIAGLKAVLAPLVARCNVGRHLVEPWRVVVAGAPNVGKSSLVNALAGYARCLVSPAPGTTRDLVTVSLALDGWPVDLIDTAGQREAETVLEQAGISLAQSALSAADLCLWVVEKSAPPVWTENLDVPILPVVNKMDLPAAWDIPADLLHVSALSGEGLPRLCDAIVTRLVSEPPPPGSAVPITAELCDRLVALDRVLAAGNLTEVDKTLRQLGSR